MTETLQQCHARLSRRLNDLRYVGVGSKNPERKKLRRAIAKIDRKIKRGKAQ